MNILSMIISLFRNRNKKGNSFKNKIFSAIFVMNRKQQLTKTNRILFNLRSPKEFEAGSVFSYSKDTFSYKTIVILGSEENWYS